MSTVAAASTAADTELRNMVAGTAVVAGIDDDVGHDDTVAADAAAAADDDDTIRCCIHPCHTEVTTRTCPTQRRNETTRTQAANISITHRYIKRVPRTRRRKASAAFSHGIRVSFSIIAIKRAIAALMAVGGSRGSVVVERVAK